MSIKTNLAIVVITFTLTLSAIGSYSQAHGQLLFYGVTNYDKYDSLFIFGELYNNSSLTSYSTHISVTFYDANNNVIGTSDTLTLPQDIPPYQTAPFKMIVGPHDITDFLQISQNILKATSLGPR